MAGDSAGVSAAQPCVQTLPSPLSECMTVPEPCVSGPIESVGRAVAQPTCGPEPALLRACVSCHGHTHHPAVLCSSRWVYPTRERESYMVFRAGIDAGGFPCHCLPRNVRKLQLITEPAAERRHDWRGRAWFPLTHSSLRCPGEWCASQTAVTLCHCQNAAFLCTTSSRIYLTFPSK